MHDRNQAGLTRLEYSEKREMMGIKQAESDHPVSDTSCLAYAALTHLRPQKKRKNGMNEKLDQGRVEAYTSRLYGGTRG